MCTMPLYMDVHRDVDASVEEVVEAHKKDLETQEKHGVKYLNYWVDDDEGPSFASSRAPAKKRARRSTKRPTVSLQTTIFEVEQGE